MAGLQGFRDSLAKLSELFSAGLISDEDYNERKVCCSLVLFFLDPPEPGQQSKVWCVRFLPPLPSLCVSTVAQPWHCPSPYARTIRLLTRPTFP